VTDRRTLAEPREPYLVGYARVSSDDQDLRLQVDALRKAGVHPDNIHTDKMSGADDRRPGFLAAMKDVREGDVLVVWKLDRLGRRLVTLLHTVEALERRKIGLKVLTDQIDTTTAAGKLMFHMLASFAEFERNLGIERTKAGLAAARARGRKGGRVPTITHGHYAKAEQFMVEGMTARAAAKAAKISPSSFYRFLEAKQEAKGTSDMEQEAEIDG
jgi:DNA invertase Pin-like site-specific DNA recombinase